MSRYVDLDKFMKFDNEAEFDVWCKSVSNDYCKTHECVECFYDYFNGREDVAPIIHAKWERDDEFWWCSNCDWNEVTVKTNYCSHCGAKMDKE